MVDSALAENGAQHLLVAIWPMSTLCCLTTWKIGQLQ